MYLLESLERGQGSYSPENGSSVFLYAAVCCAMLIMLIDISTCPDALLQCGPDTWISRFTVAASPLVQRTVGVLEVGVNRATLSFCSRYQWNGGLSVHDLPGGANKGPWEAHQARPYGLCTWSRLTRGAWYD